MVKSSNKLIGEIENKDLYDSDDNGDGAFMALQSTQHDRIGQQDIDLDIIDVKREKKQMGLLFDKLNNRKLQQNHNNVESQVTSLGFVQKISANELAANGIQLSLR